MKCGPVVPVPPGSSGQTSLLWVPTVPNSLPRSQCFVLDNHHLFMSLSSLKFSELLEGKNYRRNHCGCLNGVHLPVSCIEQQVLEGKVKGKVIGIYSVLTRWSTPFILFLTNASQKGEISNLPMRSLRIRENEDLFEVTHSWEEGIWNFYPSVFLTTVVPVWSKTQGGELPWSPCWEHHDSPMCLRAT